MTRVPGVKGAAWPCSGCSPRCAVKWACQPASPFVRPPPSALLSLPLKGSLAHDARPAETRTPRRDPASAPTARFLGMPVCVEWGAGLLCSQLGGQVLLQRLAWLCFLFTSEGGWGPWGLQPALRAETSQAARGVISASAPIRPRGSAVCQLSSVIIESSLSWNVISLGVSGLRGMPQSLCRDQLPFYLQN